MRVAGGTYLWVVMATQLASRVRVRGACNHVISRKSLTNVTLQPDL